MIAINVPQIFEVERDLGEDRLEIALTTDSETDAYAELAARGEGWRLVVYPMGNKLLVRLLAGQQPDTAAWPYNRIRPVPGPAPKVSFASGKPSV